MKNNYSDSSCGTPSVRVTSVIVSPGCTTMEPGEWFYGATAAVYPTNATNKRVFWSSSNTNVATVNASSGYIYAKAIGSARIYATAQDGSGKSDYITVTVTNSTVFVSSIELNRTSISLEKGKSFSLSATVCPENATNRTLIWSSSNENIATVNGGVIYARAKGSATISVSASDGSGKTASCTVYVNENVWVSSVTINPVSKTMAIGESAYLSAVILPENATNKCLFWASSDTSIVSVNWNSGLVIARGVGTATIYAAAQDGSRQKGSCSITVMETIPVRTVSVCPTTATMQIGETIQLTATISPANATDKNLTWHSEFPEIASVDANGNVVSQSVGTTTIYAEAGACGDKTGSCTIDVVVNYDTDEEYYINNKNTGKFIKYNNGALVKSVYQASIFQKWYFSYIGNDQYTIRTRYNSEVALYASGSAVLTGALPSELTDAYKWTVTSVSGGGVIIQNVDNDMVLYDNDSDILLTNVMSSCNINYEKSVWRVIPPSDYVCMLGFSVNDMTVDCTKSAIPVISASPTDSTWTAPEDFIYTTESQIITINNVKHTITGVTSGTATVTATHKCSGYSASFTVKVNKSAIIIVPGIMGSELIAGPNNQNYEPGTDLWSISLLDLVEQRKLLTLFGLINDLKCDVFGNPLDDVIVNPDNLYGTDDTYKALYQKLEMSYGDQYEIKFFGYDWRLSNSISANKLNQFILSNEYDKVVFVAHSMGGLVVSKYLALGDAQRAKTESVILLGSPLLGTPAAVYVWGSNIQQWPVPIADWIKNLLYALLSEFDFGDDIYCNFQSLYELFPTEKYFDPEWADKNYVITSIAGMSELPITTYAETKSRLGSYLAHFNVGLMNNAEAFHNSLYLNGEHITSLVNSYYIAGVNYQDTETESATIEKLHYNLQDWDIYSQTIHGDALVPVWSADLSNKYTSKTFYVDDMYHTWLASNTIVLNFISQLISGDSSLNSFNRIFSDYLY